jgi:hypothetical protein
MDAWMHSNGNYNNSKGVSVVTMHLCIHASMHPARELKYAKNKFICG